MPYVSPVAAAVYPYITSWIHPWKRRRDDARTPEPGSGLQPVAEVAANEILGAQDIVAEEVAREPAVRLRHGRLPQVHRPHAPAQVPTLGDHGLGQDPPADPPQPPVAEEPVQAAGAGQPAGVLD